MHMHLKIKGRDESVKQMYRNHSHFHEGDCGLDVFCPDHIVVPGGARGFKIELGIKCEAMIKPHEFPTGFYLYPRSSMGKSPLRKSNSIGVIDAGYRGEICMMVDNITDKPYSIEKGDRLVQIVSPVMQSISFFLTDSLSETTRGQGGFGSTGR